MMDVRAQLAEFAKLMRQRRVDLDLTGRDLSRQAGRAGSWAAELETGKSGNPGLGTLTEWAEQLGGEFGIYIVFDGHHTAFPLTTPDDTGDDEEWEGPDEDTTDNE
jgi:transcriptional regulator with XRE-family HTH domain